MSEATFTMPVPEGMCVADALHAAQMTVRAARPDGAAEVDRQLQVHMLVTATLLARVALQAPRPVDALGALVDRMTCLIEAALRENMTAPGGEP